MRPLPPPGHSPGGPHPPLASLPHTSAPSLSHPPPPKSGLVVQGRDANKKLQRAIRAGRLRERLPSMIEAARAALTEWQDGEGQAFLYDGRNYQVGSVKLVERGGCVRGHCGRLWSIGGGGTAACTSGRWLGSQTLGSNFPSATAPCCQSLPSPTHVRPCPPHAVHAHARWR